MEQKYYSTEQAAQRLGLPLPTFRLYRSQGKIQGAKPGKNWIHSESDLNTFYEQSKVKPENPSDYIVNHRRG